MDQIRSARKRGTPSCPQRPLAANQARQVRQFVDGFGRNALAARFDLIQINPPAAELVCRASGRSRLRGAAMDAKTETAAKPKAKTRTAVLWKAIAPVAVALILALLPPPAGLPDHAWHYFAIFAGVVIR